MRAVEKGLSGLSKQLGWRSEFDLEPLLRAAGLEVVEIRRTHPIGPLEAGLRDVAVTDVEAD